MQMLCTRPLDRCSRDFDARAPYATHTFRRTPFAFHTTRAHIVCLGPRNRIRCIHTHTYTQGRSQGRGGGGRVQTPTKYFLKIKLNGFKFYCFIFYYIILRIYTLPPPAKKINKEKKCFFRLRPCTPNFIAIRRFAIFHVFTVWRYHRRTCQHRTVQLKDANADGTICRFHVSRVTVLPNLMRTPFVVIT